MGRLLRGIPHPAMWEDPIALCVGIYSALPPPLPLTRICSSRCSIFAPPPASYSPHLLRLPPLCISHLQHHPPRFWTDLNGKQQQRPVFSFGPLKHVRWQPNLSSTVDLHVFVSLLLFFRDACQANVLLASQSCFSFLLKSSRHARPASTRDLSAALA